MLDKLAVLDRQTLGKLRHMRYSCKTPLYQTSNSVQDPLEEDGAVQYRLPHFLGLLSGLKLDRLTIVGPARADRKYLELEAMIKHCNGWKELYYLSHNSLVLGFGASAESAGEVSPPGRQCRRAPQPSTWGQALAARDGPTASVTIYRSTDAASPGAMISRPATREVFADQAARPGKESEYGVEPETALVTPGEEEKEILVVVKRGKGFDYTQSETSPRMKNDVRKRNPGMTWEVMRHMGFGDYEELGGCGILDDFIYQVDDFYDHDFGLDYELDDDPIVKDDQDLRHNTRLQGDAESTRLTHLLGSQLKLDDRPRQRDGEAGPEVDEHGCLVQVDTYRHVDDYEWGPYYVHWLHL